MPVIAAYIGHAGEDLRRSWRNLLSRLFGPAPRFVGTSHLLVQQGETHSPGASTVLHGWVDNLDELNALLGANGLSAAEAYEAAVKRWGAHADARIIGSYAAISALPDGSLRLARSPWSAPPLYYTREKGRLVASSGLKPIFAAGHPRDINYDYAAAMLALDYEAGEGAYWYRGICKVGLGTIVTLSRDGVRTDRWYDPRAIAAAPIRREEEWIGATRTLIDEASRKALAHVTQPGLMLSGGLDSPIVADSLLRRMPESVKLKSFTFVPDNEWDGIEPADKFGDERPFVEAFAAMHPRLEPHFANPEEGGFDYGLRDLVSAGDAISANVANIGPYHGPWRLAKQHKCDWLLNADFGNFTFSNKGDWAYSEYFLQTRWLRLADALSCHANDGRGLGRRFLSLSLLPLLPDTARRRIHTAFHPERRDFIGMMSLLRPEVRKRYSGEVGPGYPRTRGDWLARICSSADSGEEVGQGLEQLYGIRQRDVTAYRPLIEFCAGLPTAAFIGKGQDRRLARALANGIMPEDQRLTPKTGRHNVDWHARIGRRRAELREMVDRIGTHPFLGEVLDRERMVALLDDWPDRTDWAAEVELPRSFGLTRAFSVAQFVGQIEGRNDF